MGIVDVFSSDGTVELKYGEFYKILKETTKADLLMNAVECEVPYRYIREMMTGKQVYEEKEEL